MNLVSYLFFSVILYFASPLSASESQEVTRGYVFNEDDTLLKAVSIIEDTDFEQPPTNVAVATPQSSLRDKLLSPLLWFHIGFAGLDLAVITVIAMIGELAYEKCARSFRHNNPCRIDLGFISAGYIFAQILSSFLRYSCVAITLQVPKAIKIACTVHPIIQIILLIPFFANMVEPTFFIVSRVMMGFNVLMQIFCILYIFIFVKN